MLIRTGRFITFSLRPVHHRFFALAQKLGHRVLGFSLEFIPCILIFHFIFGVDMRPAHIPWTVVSVVLAFLVNFYFHYILGLTSFWFVESGGLRRVIQLLSMFFSGALIPLTFFPEGLRVVQYFLPFQYTVYVPAMVFIGNFQPYIILYQAFAVLIMYGVSEWVYRRAMRYYCDVGA
jgi:ABC-2 type transport system permease protein